MTVKQLPRRRPKSHKEIIDRLVAALNEARSSQYIAVGVVLVGKELDVADYFLVPGTDILAVAGRIQMLAEEVKETQYED